jgi:molecular chaperone GrpE
MSHNINQDPKNTNGQPETDEQQQPAEAAEEAQASEATQETEANEATDEAETTPVTAEASESEAEATTADASEEGPSLEDQLAIKDKMIQSLEDKYNRLQAEFDNFRKRTQREKAQIGQQANEDLLRSLLPAIDDLDRALVAAETAEDVQTIREGLQMVHKKLKNSLQKQGVEEIEAQGHEFDYDLHEAQKGKVIEVVEKGYKYNDNVIRFAKVITGE